MQVAHLNQRADHGPTRPAHAESAAWLHGVEHVTKDAGGFVYWRGLELEHFAFTHREHREEAAAARRLARTCLTLEAAGREVSPANYIGWFGALGTVHYVNSAMYTDMLGCVAHYRGRAMRDDDPTWVVDSRLHRAALALKTIEESAGLKALLDNRPKCDPSAIVLVKVSEEASPAVRESALADLQQRLLFAHPHDSPRSVAALLSESRYDATHYVTYVGMRLYTGHFVLECPSVLSTLRAMRDFARAHANVG